MDELQIVAEGTISCTPESSPSLQVRQRIQSRADAERPDGGYECGSPRTLAFGKVGEISNNGILLETGKVPNSRSLPADGRMPLVDCAAEFYRTQICFSSRAMRNTMSFMVGTRTRFALLKNSAGIFLLRLRTFTGESRTGKFESKSRHTMMECLVAMKLSAMSVIS